MPVFDQPNSNKPSLYNHLIQQILNQFMNAFQSDQEVIIKKMLPGSLDFSFSKNKNDVTKKTIYLKKEEKDNSVTDVK